MSFDARAWLQDLRRVIRSGDLVTRGQDAQLKAASRCADNHVDRIAETQRSVAEIAWVSLRTSQFRQPPEFRQSPLTEEAWKALLEVFREKIKTLAKYSSRPPFSDPLLDLGGRQEAAVDALFLDFVFLAVRFGQEPNVTKLRRVPVFHMTPQEFDDYRDQAVGLTVSEKRDIAIRNSKDPLGAAQRVLTAVLFLTHDQAVSTSKARRFAMANTGAVNAIVAQGVDAAMRSAGSVEALMALDLGLRPLDARFLAICNPDDPIAAARTAIPMVGKLRSRCGLSSKDARDTAFSNPEEAQRLLDETSRATRGQSSATRSPQPPEIEIAAAVTVSAPSGVRHRTLTRDPMELDFGLI